MGASWGLNMKFIKEIQKNETTTDRERGEKGKGESQNQFKVKSEEEDKTFVHWGRVNNILHPRSAIYFCSNSPETSCRS